MNIKTNVLAAAIVMAFAAVAEPVKYLEPVYKTAGVPTSGIDHWVTNSVGTYEAVLNDTEDEVTWTNGWYVVTNDVTITGRIACKGDVHLILSDGVTLTAPKGITVNCLENVKNSLAIYGQAEGTGRLLIEKPRERAAAIGGDYCDHGENITINGGIVKVRGGEGAAAIGGGYGDGNNITINGGNVWAIGGLKAAAIGGSFTGVAKNLTINGGTVRVSGGDDSALIGGGIRMGVAFSTGILISPEANVIFDLDGVIEDLGSPRGLTIVTPRNPQERPLMGRIEAWTGAETLTVTNAYTHETGTLTVGGGKKWFKNRNLELLAPTEENAYLRFAVSDAAIDFFYPDYNKPGDPTSGIRTWMGSKIRGGTYRSVRNAVKGDTWTNGWYVVEQDNVVIDTDVRCEGDVHLILVDGAQLTVNGSIVVNSDYAHLTVYGQWNNSGRLIAARSTGGYAAIGGGYGRAGGNITINGGQVLADVTTRAAAIGGGEGGMGTNIVINGGRVWARNGDSGTGTVVGGTAIGGAHGQPGGGITINGGRVHACAYFDGDIIGSGAGAEVSKSVRISPDAHITFDGRHAPTPQPIFVTGERSKLLLDEPKAKDLVGGLVDQSGLETLDVTVGSGNEPVEMTVNGNSAEFGGERWRLGRGERTGRLRFARARQTTGIFVNGREVGEGMSSEQYGWTYANGVLTLTGGYHTITGENTEGDVRIVVDSSGENVTLQDVTLIYTNGVNAITFTKNARWNVFLVLRGTNTIYGVSPANDTYEAICVDGDAQVHVDAYEGEGGVLRGGYDGGQGTGRPTNYRGVWVREGGWLYWGSGTLSGYAATIGQTGGGIAIAKGGTMTFAGGTITNCYCNAGGGAIGVREGAVFNLLGGTIIDCHAGDTNATHVIHNAGAASNAALSGGRFDVHPLEHSSNVVLKEHCRVWTFGNRYVVAPSYYCEPVYITPGDPASGIFCWKTNTVALGSCDFVGDREGAETWCSGWYVVEKDAVRNGRIGCDGDVRLILSDGATLTVNGGFGVPPNARLTIYAQEKGTGALKIRNIDDCRAGIGGAKDVPNGPITIHGGNVDVFSGQKGAAIGGGENAVGANITINGGRIFANAIEYGAGIGGGYGGMGTNIVINAGTVMAVAGMQKCAAIGGGRDAAGRDITINGGKVRTLAYSENNFIGDGGKGSGGNIRIAREATLVFCFVHHYDLLKLDYPTSTILLPEENVLTSRSLVCGAGPWDGPTAFTITNVATHAATDVTVGGGTSILEKRAFELPAPSAQDDPLKLVVTPPPTTYLEPVYNTAGDPASGIDHWETNVTEKATFVTSSFYEVTWTSGWYVVEGDIEMDGRIGCEGDVHLVLTDGATLTAKGGIAFEGEKNHLTIYGQEEGTGTLLSVSESESAAGIGGNVTINGGIVTAFGGQKATAIGGAGANVILNGGTILPVVANNGVFIDGAVIVNSGAKLVFNLTDEAFPSVPGDITNSTIFVRDYQTPRNLIGGLKRASGFAKNFTVLCPETGDIAEITPGGDIVACAHRWLALTAVDKPTFALQVLSEAVTFRVPVYRRPSDPKSGIDRWEEVTKQPREMTLLNIATNVVWKDGWYVVDGNLTYHDRIGCQGDVHLILKDGATLTAGNGITVLSGAARLTIYAQEKGTGKLISRATVEGDAGIGGISLEGGSNITINGGTVEAYGAYHAAGIGGGYYDVGTNLVVNAGTVTAVGGVGGAGIGGGCEKEGNGIVVNGGTVMAQGGGMEAAGIGGGGAKGKGRNITINAGTVTAIGGKEGGTGIGGGKGGTAENLTLNGGTIRPVAVTNEAFIGTSTFVELREAVVTVRPEALFVFDVRHGEQLAELTGITNSTVIVPERPVPHTLINGIHMGTGVATNWTVRCPATGDWADIAPGDDPVMCGPRAVALEDPKKGWIFSLQVFGAPAAYRVPVYNEEGDPKSGIKRWEEKIHSSAGLNIVNLDGSRVWKDGWYVVESDLTINERVACEGMVHLIVPDGVTLRVPQGISVLSTLPVSRSLTIYSGFEGTGKLIAGAPSRSAAIGGEEDRWGGNITINGGTVEAGGYESAGIGGGDGAAGKNIVINGGKVMARGGYYGAGIGGGWSSSGTNIVINGGYVMAQGGREGGAAIGGGKKGEGRDITLNGGTVVATVDIDYESPDIFSPALIGSGYGAASPMSVRISKDVILVYDLLREHERVFTTTYTNSTLITRDVSKVQFAELGVVPDAEGNWTGPETFLVTNVDTHATAKIKVNAPSIDWGDRKVRLAYRPKYGGLMLCPATDHTGVFVNGDEVGPEYSAEEREKMGWRYDKANKLVHIENGGDFRVTGCNVDGDVRFIVDVCAHLLLDNLKLVYPGDNGNAFTIGQGTLGVRASLIGVNTIYGHAVYEENGEGESDQERDAVFRVSNGAVLTVYDGGNGALHGNYSNYCATWVCSGGQLFWSGGTALYYNTICWSFGLGVCQCGIFDHHPIESKVCGFELGKHSQIKEIDDLFYVYSYWYEEPVYRTPGDPKSGIDRWETNILDWAQCVVLSSASNNIAIGNGWRVVDKYCRIEGGIWYEGNVRLLVTDGATLSIAKGLNTTNETSSLTIYGQGYRDGLPTGKIVCNGGGAAAIGGIVEYEPVMHGGDGNNITINGCEIEATVEDGGGGAVIGGHFWHGATNIVINGGLLNLSAGYARSAIIGGAAFEAGKGCEGRDIVINGGTINDLSPHGSAGIGCGRNCGGAWPVGSSNLVVNGGSINASVGDDTHKPSTTLYKVVDTNNVPNVGPLEIAGLGTYGVRDIFPAKLTNDVNQLTFYLPEPAGTYWVNGVCHAYRNGGATDAKPYSPEAAGPFDTEEEARAYAATVYVPRPNKDVEGVVSAVDYGMMFKFVFREGTNAGWYAEPALKDEVIKDVTETIEDETVTALLAASVTNDVPQTVLWTRAGLYYGIGGSTDVKDAGTVPNWLLGDGKIQTLEGAKPATATDKAFYRIRVTPTL